MDARFVLLLRGVNVGGRNRLAMKDLAGALEGAGATRVTTLLQSGNALFWAEPNRAPRLAGAAMRALGARAGFEPRFTLRSGAEFVRVARAHPCAAKGRDPARLHVGFLTTKPTVAAARELAARVGADESLLVKGREVFVHYGRGVGRSKLTADLFDRTLATMCTMRNWNTVCALAALASDEH